ncbi:MAG: hypothetical protein JW929_13660 [Anaerolineales bacterium]|nr:hypothetical protein [Anaerolineales bacterium]
MPAATGTASVSSDAFTRRSIRAWWADGLWDLALAGFWAITALWTYPLVIALAFPSWSWPWPFITKEPINPLKNEVAFWGAALLAVWIAYIFLAWLLVTGLKRRFVAPRLGDVRHAFFLPIGRSFGLIFAAAYALGCLALAFLFWKARGGPHLFSVFMIVSFAGVMYLVGRKFDIRRYRWIAAAGSGLCIAAELLTTNAVYLEGPKHFLDVSPFYGNPSLPSLIWAALLLISGITAFRRVLRLPYAQT